jgi:hypothetical protein
MYWPTVEDPCPVIFSTTPRRAATSLAEAIASFAPHAKLIARLGDGALVAVATASRRGSTR